MIDSRLRGNDINQNFPIGLGFRLRFRPAGRDTYFCVPKNKSPTKRAPRFGTLRVPCDARQTAALRNSSLRSSNSPRLTRHFAALLGAFEGGFSTARDS